MYERGPMKFFLILLICQSAHASELSGIANHLQALLTGAYNTNILKKDQEFSGSDINAELMFDTFILGREQRYCVFIRQETVKIYKTLKERSCLGEKVLDLKINENWSWIYTPTRYLGKEVMTLRLRNKKSDQFYDVRLPNMSAEPIKTPTIWDAPQSKYPFGFSIYPTEPEFD